MKVQTDRLDLIPATLDLLVADLAGPNVLAEQLGAVVPSNWPPDLYDRDALDHSFRYLQAEREAAGWVFWYLLLKRPSADRPVTIGICGFKGKPSPTGTVEIGYSVLGQFRCAGYATETVAALVDWAFSHPSVRQVIAETYPDLRASIRVLEKNGFQLLGTGSEERVIRFGRLKG